MPTKYNRMQCGSDRRRWTRGHIFPMMMMQLPRLSKSRWEEALYDQNCPLPDTVTAATGSSGVQALQLQLENVQNGLGYSKLVEQLGCQEFDFNSTAFEIGKIFVIPEIRARRESID